MAPEQCRGSSDIDGRTDVYSLAVVLFEMLAGHPPFIAETIEGLLGQHLFVAAPPLAPLAPQAPGALVGLVQRMLLKEPSQRPIMVEVASKLGELRAGFSRTQSSRQQLLPSCQPRSADSDATRIQSLPRTTLGRSLGKIRSLSRGQFSAAIGCILLIMLTAVGFWWVRIRIAVHRHPLSKEIRFGTIQHATPLITPKDERSASPVLMKQVPTTQDISITTQSVTLIPSQRTGLPPPSSLHNELPQVKAVLSEPSHVVYSTKAPIQPPKTQIARRPDTLPPVIVRKPEPLKIPPSNNSPVSKPAPSKKPDVYID